MVWTLLQNTFYGVLLVCLFLQVQNARALWGCLTLAPPICQMCQSTTVQCYASHSRLVDELIRHPLDHFPTIVSKTISHLPVRFPQLCQVSHWKGLPARLPGERAIPSTCQAGSNGRHDWLSWPKAATIRWCSAEPQKMASGQYWYIGSNIHSNSWHLKFR